MYLKRLEVQGFKSFADKLKLDFNKGITAVVGPNGSGKSNVADAVRWVLGEQSAKSLRGAKMEDIIFAGTQNRKPLGFAEVSIIIDNSDEKMPISYMEVTVTRRVYRSGESEYFINRTPCRLKDIHELFMDTGVGKEGYSIIGQGQIDKILSTKPEDRRLLFEEAVGIVKYKNRRQEAEKKLEEEKQNLIRVEDIIGELEKQLGPLGRQAEVAKKYLEIKEQLKLLDLNIFISESDLLKEELNKTNMNYRNIDDEITKNKLEQQKIKKLESELKSKQLSIEKEIEDSKENLSNLQMSIEKYEGNINLTKEQILHLKDNIHKLKKNIQSLIIKKQEKEKEKTRFQVQHNGLSLQIESKSKYLAVHEEKFKEINSSLSENELHIEAFKSEMIEKLNLTSDIKSKIQRLTTLFEHIENRRNQIIKEQSYIKSQIHDKMARLQVLNKNKEALSLELNQIKVELEQAQQTQTLNGEQLLNYQNDLSLILQEFNAAKSKYKILKEMANDYEGFYRSVKSILFLKEKHSDQWRGIHGVVADLITVPKGYETAVEIALGGAIQNIVTDTEQTAQRAIEYLKGNRLGRATFLPLTSVTGRDLNSEKTFLLKEEGVLGVASEIIEYHEVYKNIVSSLLGRVIIVDQLSNGIKVAKKYKHRYKIVTLEGDILNPGGSMTGGSTSSKANNIFMRARELNDLKKQLEKLHKEAEQQKTLIEEGKSKEKILLEEMKDLQNNAQEIHMKNVSLEHQIQQIQEGFLSLEEKKKDLQFEKDQLEEQYDETNKSLIEQNEILKDFDGQIKNIENNIEQYQSSIQTDRSSREELSGEITNIKIEISTLQQEQKAIVENMKRISIDIEQMHIEIDQQEEEIKNNQVAEQEKEKALIDLRNNIVTKKELITTQKLRLEELEKNKRNHLDKLHDLEKEIEDLSNKISLLEKEIHRIENIKIKIELQQENVYNKIWEEYQLTYQSAQEYKKDIGSLNEMKQKSEQYKKEVQQLGNVNVNAIDEYKQVSERYEFLTSQKQDILEAEEKLGHIIDELVLAMEKQFAEQFGLISAHFNSVFQELFGGGRGHLELVDPENILESGINIIAQPPGKKLQNMMLLSGGERALTAIALLFSILKIKPSPFCILDEIEAALDDANVNRYASFLQRFTSDTQFIVITHRKGTMEAADALYGITMQEQGVSTLVSVKFSEQAS